MDASRHVDPPVAGRFWWVVVVAAVLACKGESAHVPDKSAAALAACQQGLTNASQTSDIWKSRYQTEARQFDDFKDQARSSLPEALQRLRSQEDDLMKQLPQQVRIEVQNRLEAPLVAAGQEFQRLHETIAQLEEIMHSQKKEQKEFLGKVEKDTGEAVQARNDGQEKMKKRLIEMQSSQQHTTEDLVDIKKDVEDFDKRVDSEKNLAEHLGLSSKKKKELHDFLTRLAEKLEGLKERLGAKDAQSGAEPKPAS